MATKTVAWNSGNGVITLTYTGQGNGSVSVKSDANDSFDERSQNLNIVTTAGSPEKVVQVLVKQSGKPLGWTTKDFDYTGSVQEVTLPKGRYKLQCWGAQGGNVTGAYAALGSKGGYSEGIITLTETTTLYIFVGGQGTSYTSSSDQTSTTVLNGGWNGGGAGVRTSLYDSNGELGMSFPRSGGGATDIALVTSSMSYSGGRTNRSSASLLSRIIVAGGGAGASARYTKKTSIAWNDVTSFEGVTKYTHASLGPYMTHEFFDVEVGKTYRIKVTSGSGDYKIEAYSALTAVSGSYLGGNYGEYTLPTGTVRVVLFVFGAELGETVSATLQVKETTIDESSNYTTGESVGGGTGGRGIYIGTQSSASNGGAFGLGGSQTATNYRYVASGGGGGWYGGGTGKSNTTSDYIRYSGGGSGFVNTAANASYRPSGYTGLQLDSGVTRVGNDYHESPSGGTEAGHSGNGYARITVIN